MRSTVVTARPARWIPLTALLALTGAAPAVRAPAPNPPAERPVPPSTADSGAKRWTDDQLVASYMDLVASGGLEAAVRSPNPPKDPPQPRFFEGLAWYAAGMPETAGALTTTQVDAQTSTYVHAYLGLIKAKVEGGEANDYARTRTWKVVQKLTLLRDEMEKPERAGRFPFPAMKKDDGAPGADAWDKAHSLQSPADFSDKVCRASRERPVLVKFGNTNCTQCMLFEILGSVREVAENPAHKGALDVYKVWWGYPPDAGFPGRIRDPKRLDDLVKAEGVKSSPTFMVYRDGHATMCGDAFPDDHGDDERIDACLRQDLAAAPVSVTCASLAAM